MPVHVVFSLGAFPEGIKIIPLAFPFSSVVIDPLNADSELPAIPVYLASGFTQRAMFWPYMKA